MDFELIFVEVKFFQGKKYVQEGGGLGLRLGRRKVVKV